MEITIKTELGSTLTKLAEGRSITEQEYVENYVNAHLLSQYKQNIVDKVLNEPVANLPQIESVIVIKKQELKDAFDLANPIKFVNTELQP